MKIGQEVSAFVDECYPFGVFVRLDDDSRAYIRKRQLTLEGDVDPRDLLKKGDRLVARVYRLPTAKHTMELSVREAMPDPWPNFTRQHQPGDVVVATVKNLSHDRIYASATQLGFLGDPAASMPACVWDTRHRREQIVLLKPRFIPNFARPSPAVLR